MSTSNMMRFIPSSGMKQQNVEQHVCGKAQFNSSALDIMSNMIVRLRARGNVDTGCFCPLQDWVDGVCALEPIPHIYDPMRAKQDKNASRCIEDAREQLIVAADALQKLQECVLRQVEECQAHARALRMRAGISSIPDEILAPILNYAIPNTSNWNDNDDSGASASIIVDPSSSILRPCTAAGILSLTCRRFRYVMTHNSDVWCRIWSGMKSNLVSTLCGRLKRPNAEIIFEIPLGESFSTMDQFISTVCAYSKYWSRFQQMYWPAIDSSSKDETWNIAHKTRHLEAPFLKTLIIIYRDSTLLEARGADDPMHYFSTWKLPRLTSFAVHDFIPVPFTTPPANLTSFTIEIGGSFAKDQYAERMNVLVVFLASCLNLRKLKMSLFGFESLVESHLGHPPIALSSVEVLGVEFFGCQTPLIRSFFDTVHFPQVSSLDLKIEFYLENGTMSIQDLLNAVLPDSYCSKFSHLRHVSLMLKKPVREPIALPFSSLQSVEDLTLMISGIDLLSIHSLPDKPCLPSLRSLTFQDCRDLDVDIVCALMGRLKEQGNFPTLAMRNCKRRIESQITEEEYSDDDGESGMLDDESDEGTEESEPKEKPVHITAEEILSMIP